MNAEIKRKIQRLQGYWSDLSPYLTMDADALLSNKEKLASMELGLTRLVSFPPAYRRQVKTGIQSM